MTTQAEYEAFLDHLVREHAQQWRQLSGWEMTSSELSTLRTMLDQFYDGKCVD